MERRTCTRRCLRHLPEIEAFCSTDMVIRHLEALLVTVHKMKHGKRMMIYFKGNIKDSDGSKVTEVCVMSEIDVEMLEAMCCHFLSFFS